MSSDHDHEMGFWRRYVFSTDHKVIGIWYALTGLFFLFFGFCLMMIMRWQLAFPLEKVPVIGGLLGSTLANDGVLLPEGYNALGAMHGTIMIFLGVVPIVVQLTSKDVIHSFSVPVLRIKQDTIPGMRIPISFTAKESGVGTYEVACAQLCGSNHYSMRALMYVQSQSDFDAWLIEAGKPPEEFFEDDLD